MATCTAVGASGCAQSQITTCPPTCILLCGDSTAISVCGTLAGTCYCWQYSGTNAGKVQAVASDGGACNATCGSNGNPGWN